MTTILLHGLGQTPASWDATVSAMGETASVLRPDLFALPGEKERTYPHVYRAFEEYCMGQPGPLNLCGLSLGGVLALQYAIEHPGRVNAMALIGVQYVMPKNLLKLQNLIFRVMPGSAFRPMGLEKGDVLRLCGSMARLDFRRELTRAVCPALVLCGERDRANRKAALGLAEHLPHARLLVLPNAGHEANVDAPEQLGGALKEFFARFPANPQPHRGKEDEPCA